MKLPLLSQKSQLEAVFLLGGQGRDFKVLVFSVFFYFYINPYQLRNLTNNENLLFQSVPPGQAEMKQKSKLRKILVI